VGPRVGLDAVPSVISRWSSAQPVAVPTKLSQPFGIGTGTGTRVSVDGCPAEGSDCPRHAGSQGNPPGTAVHVCLEVNDPISRPRDA
jgi:hypothetical protein